MFLRNVFKNDPRVLIADFAVLADRLGQFFRERLLHFLRPWKHPDVHEWHIPSLFADTKCRENLIQQIFRGRFPDDFPEGAQRGLEFERNAFLIGFRLRGFGGSG